MKSNLLSLCLGLAASLALSPAIAHAGDAPDPLTLQEVLRLQGGKAVIFQPIPLESTHQLKVTHIAFGDGSVKPGEKRAVQLVVYSAAADENGNHAVLFNRYHELGDAKSPVLNFDSYSPAPEPALAEASSRSGIIAVLIGLLKTRSGELVPAVLPKNDAISALVDPGTGGGLLLPAVQKVREAASR